MSLKGLAGRVDALGMRRRSVVVERPLQPAGPVQLTVASESQVWRRSTTSMAGERAPAGTIHAVLGASPVTLCGLDHSQQLARFPYVDFVGSGLPRCEICRSRGAALLH